MIIQDVTPDSPMYFFIDESGFDNESKIIILGLVILNDPVRAREKIRELIENILHDPILRTIPNAENKLRKGGLHYSEDSYEIRNKYIGFMSELTFQAYICFVEKKEIKEIDYKEWYKKLIGRLLFDRIRDYRHEKIHIFIEKTDRKEQKNVLAVVNRVVDNINKSHRIKVSSKPVIEFSSKGEPCISLVDYVCGIFKDHYENLHLEGSRQKRNFNRIRGKIRLIHDFLTNVFYSRKNPFM